MALHKIDHISILAKNSQKTVDFYKEIFGFIELFREDVELMHMKIIFLGKGDDRIEIIEPTGGDIKMNDGLKHIAILSDDIEADYKALEAKGVMMLHKEVQRHEDLAFFFIKSPSGEFVEVIQHFNK